MSPARPSFPPQPRVYSRNQPFLPSRAPRNANISPILSTLRILPVATGVCPFFASSRHSFTQSARREGSLATRHCPFIFSNLRTLFLSLRSFSDSHRLFSIACGLFLQNTRGGIPLRELVRCIETQKCLFVSPLLATLTHSVSRKSFPCHSYANTRDGGVTAATNFERFQLPTRLPRAFVAKGRSFTQERSSRRSLPFAHAGQFPPQASSVQPPETPRLCGPILFAQPLVSSLKPPEPDAKMTACSHHGDTKLPHCGQSMSEPIGDAIATAHRKSQRRIL